TLKMKEDSEIYTGLLTPDDALVPLEAVEVYGDIIGRGTKVKICQHFRNTEQNPIEAVYRFPLPESATICGFRAIVGDKVIEGEIEEREKAFELYDKALSEGHGAQLLDQERPNIFTLSVGNIKPGDSAVIEISYIELMESHNSEIRFFLPTTISPRYIPADQPDKEGIPVNDLVNPPLLLDVPYGLNIDINIHDRERISSIESPSHTINTRFSDKTATVSFSSETAAMDRDFVLNVAYGREFDNRGFLYRDQNGAFIQVDFTAADASIDKTGGAGVGREMIFVLDCSGSMQGESINEARTALKIMIGALHLGTMFNIYLFGSSFSHLYPCSEAYNEKTMKEALKYLSEAEASLGGTAVLGPLSDIYKKEPEAGFHRDVILITDGEIGNEDQVMDLVKHHADQTNVYTVGIGSGPNELLIRGVARASGGASEMVAPGEKIEPKILRLFGNALAGGIRNIHIDWNAEVKQAPENPVLFQGQYCSIFARFKDANQEAKSVKISGRTMSGMKEWVVGIQPVTEKNISVSKLWARERIRDLEEGHAVLCGSRRKERVEEITAKEIIEISRKYGIISSKTSLVGVEKRPKSKRSASEIVLRKVPAMLTTGWGGHAARPQFEGTLFSFSLTSFDAPPSPRRKVDPLLEILSLQRPGGGFNIEMPVGELLQLSRSELRKFVSDKSNEIKRMASAKLEEMIRIQAEEIARIMEYIIDQTRMIRRIAAGQIEEIISITAKVKEMLKDASAKSEEMRAIAYEIEKLNSMDYFEILETMIVLHMLEFGFAARRSEWEGVVEKSRNFFEAQKRTFMPIVAHQMEDWVQDFVKGRLKGV
ncbi:MAG: VIT domain-containing protein, partial [Nitrospirota bacterium]